MIDIFDFAPFFSASSVGDRRCEIYGEACPESEHLRTVEFFDPDGHGSACCTAYTAEEAERLWTEHRDRGDIRAACCVLGCPAGGGMIIARVKVAS